ncbi:GIY-YIG nuclease family protein [Erysipelothrix urinaevulpis]|uniref:GIY-YIG nuclease family protein n=1 Tax=Erysipelothrix urinaevulpis TaxID=2683717 RepID=UPI001358D35F|nr:GIY-YIG nuclease family protein [Erysipelothrix urinaevulpis]
MYVVYMIRCDDNSLYTGITTDLSRRMKEHVKKTPKAAAYTKSRNVISLEALWHANDRSSASKLEYSIKKLSKPQKEALILDPDVFDGYEVGRIEDRYFDSFK